jgi:hypothetical protein
MLSIGLDPSLTGFGWCVHDSDAVGPARVSARGRFSSHSKEIFVKRYMGMRACIEDLLDDWPEVRVVGVESPPFGEQFSEGLYGLFLYVCEAVYSRRRDVVFFDPSTVKCLTKKDPSVRKGRMFKSDMIEAARADTGIPKWNADEADAYHIAHFAARFYLLVEGSISVDSLTPSERHSFQREHTFVRGKHAGETRRYGTIFRENDRFFRFSTISG